jgi:hypothetical protein
MFFEEATYNSNTLILYFIPRERHDRLGKLSFDRLIACPSLFKAVELPESQTNTNDSTDYQQGEEHPSPS